MHKSLTREEHRSSHLSQFGVINEVRSVSVDEGTQGQAILPAEVEEKTGVKRCSRTPDVEQKTKGMQRIWDTIMKHRVSRSVDLPRQDCSLLFWPQSGAFDQPDVEVLHVDVPIGGSLPLAPQQQTLLCRGL